MIRSGVISFRHIILLIQAGMHTIVDPSRNIRRDRIPNNDHLIRCQFREPGLPQYAKAAVKESSGRLLRIMYIELFEDQIPAAIYQLFKGQCSLLELSPERVVDSFKDRNLAIKSIDKSPF